MGAELDCLTCIEWIFFFSISLRNWFRQDQVGANSSGRCLTNMLLGLLAKNVFGAQVDMHVVSYELC